MMSFTLTSNSAIRKTLEKMRKRAESPRAMTGRIGEELLRMTQRKAPRGRRRGAQGLRQSLHLGSDASDTVVSIQSPKPYARIQNLGGTIVAGSGPLKSKYLVVPLNDAAHRILEGLGASQSLRSVKGLHLLKTRRLLLLVEEVKGSHKGKNRLRDMQRAVFVLVRSVTLQPNPAPRGYTPDLADPAVQDILTRNAKRFLLGGER